MGSLRTPAQLTGVNDLEALVPVTGVAVVSALQSMATDTDPGDITELLGLVKLSNIAVVPLLLKYNNPWPNELASNVPPRIVVSINLFMAC
jgi:hypothetical protein